MTTGKTIAFNRWTFVGKVMSLLLNMLSRLVIVFLPSSKCLLISWPQSPFSVILEPKKIKSVSVFSVSSSICYEVMAPDAISLVFWMLSLKPTFSLSSFTFIKSFFSSTSLSAIRAVSSAYLSLLIFLPENLISACASSNPAFHMTYLAYFKSWKLMMWKCCPQYASKFGKLSSGHRTGKGQFSFQSQRKAKPNNAQTTTQLHSSHMLVK